MYNWSHGKHELTDVRDSRWERRVARVSDLRLLELARFRLEGPWDSRDSNGLLAFVPLVVPFGEGCCSAEGRASAVSSFLSVVLLFRPQQRVSF